MERTSWRRRARAFVPALLLLFALAGWMLPAAPGPAAEADAVLETGEGEPCPTVPAGQKLIALTFDDGPRRSTTTRLLDGLSERGVKATFFLIGAQIENNGDVVRRMDEALLKSTLGHNDFLLRPPYGMLDESVKAWAGCPIILWSIDPEDWRDQNTDRVVREVVAGARDGGIILMHDIFPESVDAALQIVDQLHQQGYLFCTVDELFAARGLPLEAGEMYWNAYP